MDRTTDGRIIDKRVVIEKSALKKILLDVKKKNNLTYKQLADKFNVSEHTIMHDWVAKGNTIPLSVLDELIKMSNLNLKYLSHKIKIKDPFWGQKFKDGVLKTKIVKIPNLYDEKFAEFYGALLGDGCLFSDLTGFAISGNKFLDYFYYHNHLRNLIFSLYGVYPSIYTSKKDKSIKCVVYSKEITRYLAKIGFPIGVKYEKNPTIPSFIFKKKRNLAACIKGLMDTDGSLSSHPNVKIMIHLSITIGSLRRSVENGLERLGIKGVIFNKGIMIYGIDKIRKFNGVIGFSNYKNIYKYDIFTKTGKVPSSEAVEIFIRNKAGV